MMVKYWELSYTNGRYINWYDHFGKYDKVEDRYILCHSHYTSIEIHECGKMFIAAEFVIAQRMKVTQKSINQGAYE